VNQSSKLTVSLVCLFALPFCGFGWFALTTGLRQLSHGATELGWMAIAFGLIFFICGMGLILAALFNIPRIKRRNRTQAENPASPWMWRSDWAEGRCNSKTRATLVNAWTMALLWNLISCPIFYFVPTDTYRRNPLSVSVLVFPIGGVCLLVWAIRETVASFEFGKTYFQMTDVPIAVGRELRGAIQARFRTKPEHGIRLKLSCVNIVISRSGKDQTTGESILWRDEHIVLPQGLYASPVGTTIPVTFDIPVDARPTDSTDPHNAIAWLLQAEADVPGVDYKDIFEIPVFRTKDTPAEAETHFLRDAVPKISAPLAPTIQVSSTAEGIQFYFPAARNKGFAAGVSTFLLIWTAVLILILHLKAPIIFPLVFGLFELLFLYITLQMWFGTSTVIIDRNVVRFRSGLFDQGRFSEFKTSEISGVEALIGSQQGGATGTPYYDIQLVNTDGKKITVGQTIRDKQEAEWVVSELRKALGLGFSRATAVGSN
jgi:hypothetical protein